VMQRALGLRSPIMSGRNFNRSHAVGFRADFGSDGHSSSPVFISGLLEHSDLYFILAHGAPGVIAGLHLATQGGPQKRSDGGDRSGL